MEQHIINKPEDFKEMFDAVNPQDLPLPAPWEEKLNQLQKMIVIKSVRPDKVIPAIQNWVSTQIGEKFIYFPAFDLEKSFKDST